MKVIFFPKYTRLGASSRLRTHLYLKYFQDQGITCDVKPFFNDVYLKEVYQYKRHNKWLSFLSFLRRIIDLTTVRHYDKVVIEKELFPYFPALFERLLVLFKVPYIVDYDDAIFHNYDVSPNRLIRLLLSDKIKSVMKYSSLVIAGNDYIAKKATEAGAKNVTFIPTVIDIEKYQVKSYQQASAFTIGWIGSPITYKYLSSLKPVFEKLAAQYPIRLKLIGANKGIGLPNIEEIVHWNENDEATQIQSFNVGIMPLEDNIWERGKCGYKLIQYMGCGVPVVGTPIGVNNQIIIDGENGFKANTHEDWYNHLLYFITSGIEIEKRMGLAGRLFVERNYSLQVYQKKYATILNTP